MYLNNHSFFSLRYGTLSIEELLEQASNMSVESLALTDINTTMGIPDFVKAASSKGIKPVAGCEFRNGDQLLYIGLARNREGLKELNDWLTEHNLQKKEFPAEAPRFNQVYVIYPFSKKHQKLHDHEFIGVRPDEVNQLLTSPYLSASHRLVILQPVSFTNQSGWHLHKSLRAIDHNTLISKLSPSQSAPASEIMLPPTRLYERFSRYPEIIRNTQKVLDDCNITIDFSSIKNKKVFTHTVSTDKQLLEKLAFEGMIYRYGTNNREARERVRHELNIIFKLNFSSYFLIAWDIIRYSMSRDIYHVGRGSGANSIVAYCLRITDVDPIKLNLYFERFLNPKRTSPPDFDIDYSWRDRDEIQQYIFKRYGKEHTALLGATSTFKGRSIYRELGKVFGLPKEEIDRLIRDPGNRQNQNKITEAIEKLAQQMADFPNARSIHAGGILISEEPITYYSALDLPPKGLPTTQWDMYVAEDLRFDKLDILSQRGIGHIKETVEIVRENQGKQVDVHQVNQFFQDKEVKKRLQTAETNGCFYIESPAMRGLLKKLQCNDYLTLVAASSIIRPGVAKSGMMRQYIHRFHHPNGFQYLHPIMKEQLEETYGVMVYQEDVIKVAHHFAGLDLAEADVLRRAMSGKYRSRTEFQRIEDTFFSNCRAKGYPDALSLEVWRQIESFAGYSFSKAHSASYAVESFQSLFLKTYFPLEFMVAVINNFGGFYRPWVYFNEAQRCGAHIELPCVNHSRNETRITGRTIYTGFVFVQNLEQQTISRLVSEREKNGPFQSLADFIERVTIGKEQLTLLIRLGAFRFTQKTKAALLWEGHLLLNKPVPKVKSPSIFQVQERNYQLPKLEQSPLRDAYDEIELLEFPISISLFDLLQTRFRGEVFAKNMLQHVGRKVRMLGRLVTIKYVRTVKKEMMHFGTFVDVYGEFFDSIHFPPSLKQYPFRGDGIYLLLGKVVEEFGYPSLEVEKMAKMPFQTAS
ncbi:DNA polymerase III subunit alpha [Sunxiuqinia rutila]|uniref:DNA polymerase III subunit alpha n=1 Tax=Sunxiuqinia rutila TaxID=1397841 RepID=UPI003D36C95B